LAVLAIDPVVLADVWDEISTHFPPYWQQAVRNTDESFARARNAPPFDSRAIVRKVMASLFPELGSHANGPDDGVEHRREPEARWPELVPTDSELALASLGAGQEPTSGPPHGELDWSDEIPFTHLEIVTAHNIGEVELRQGLSVQVDYRRQRLADHGSALIVWFSGALILTKADCTARLQDTKGVERAQALAQQGTLTFSLADVDRPETLTGWTVVCDYRKERFIDARFAVVLHPPAPGRRSA